MNYMPSIDDPDYEPTAEDWKAALAGDYGPEHQREAIAALGNLGVDVETEDDGAGEAEVYRRFNSELLRLKDFLGRPPLPGEVEVIEKDLNSRSDGELPDFVETYGDSFKARAADPEENKRLMAEEFETNQLRGDEMEENGEQFTPWGSDWKAEDAEGGDDA